MSAHSQLKLFWCLAALLVGAVFLVYAQTFGFEALQLDDACYTTICPFVSSGFNWQNVKTAFTGDFSWAGIWMPLTSVTYMLTISLFGPSAGAHHAVNVVFHALNAVLFFGLLVRLIAKVRADASSDRSALLIAFTAAALWALHPLRVESVAWIASRKDTVFTFFTLIGLLCWNGSRWFLAWVAMALACLSKPTAVCFPFLAMTVEFVGTRSFGRFDCRAALRLIGRYLPCFLIALATGLVATYSQHHMQYGEDLPLFSQPLPWRALNAAVSLGMQLCHAACPVGLTYFYRPMPGQLPLHAATGLVSLAVACLLLTAVWVKSKCPLRQKVFWTALWFAASLGPTLGLFASFGRQAFADRFTYVPMMAFSILIATTDWGRFAKGAGAALVAATLAFAGVSAWYAGTFRDNITVHERVIECDPEDPEAVRCIGSTLLSKGDPDKAIPYLRRALQLDPSNHAGVDLFFALYTRRAPGDMEEAWKMTAPIRADPSLDTDGLILSVLSREALKAGDEASARRLLEAQARVENPQFSSQARAILKSLDERKLGPRAGVQ